jgi:CheY-like chemotaxis protein
MSTILLVDDDPLQAQVRKSVLQRHFAFVERAADAAEAFIRAEDPKFAASLGLIIVALSRPGMSVNTFVTEFSTRLPHVPVLVLGRENAGLALNSRDKVWTLPETESPDRVLAISRQMLLQQPAGTV